MALRNVWLEGTANVVRDYLETEEREPVAAPLTVDVFRNDATLALPERGRSAEEVLNLLQRVAMLSPRVGGTQNFDLLFGGRLFPAIAGDVVASALNCTMHSVRAAGIHVHLERLVVERLCKAVGYPEGTCDGILTPGGSLSNLMALVMARDAVLPKYREDGGDTSMLRAYVSEGCHYSLRKAAAAIGVGSKNVVFVPTDDRGCLLVDALRNCVREDIAAHRKPFFIAATAGTTAVGALDDLKSCAEIADECGAWFHADAAFGGGLLLSKRTSGRLAGIETARSVAWSTHKMMGVPVTGGALLVREHGVLEKSFRSEGAGYLFQRECELGGTEPGNKTLQCGRRNDALKVWAAWQSLGDEGFSNRIEKQLDNARYAAKQVRARSWCRLAMEPQSLVVLFLVHGIRSSKLVRILEARQIAKLGFADFKGVEYVRMVCANAGLEHSDLDLFFLRVEDVRLELLKDS